MQYISFDIFKKKVSAYAETFKMEVQKIILFWFLSFLESHVFLFLDYIFWVLVIFFQYQKFQMIFYWYL